MGTRRFSSTKSSISRGKSSGEIYRVQSDPRESRYNSYTLKKRKRITSQKKAFHGQTNARGRDGEVIVTSRRLKSLIKEEERLVAKIADLQSRLEEVRKAKKMEEDAEILKSFRSMELETWDLYNLANGIKDGEISMEMLRQVMAAGADGKDTAGDAGVSNEALNNPENTVASGPLEGGNDPNPEEMNQETADQRMTDQEEMDPEEIENALDEHRRDP